MKSTFFGLLAEFGAAEIRLDDCCDKYFGLNIAQAKRRAAEYSLPVTAYRSARSQKAGWLVSAADLAEYLDVQRAEAEKLRASMQHLRA